LSSARVRRRGRGGEIREGRGRVERGRGEGGERRGSGEGGDRGGGREEGGSSILSLLFRQKRTKATKLISLHSLIG
jgi:hypothetical protein